MNIVSSKQILENIYTIAAKRNFMIKDIEAAAGVSSGYFSKLRNSDSDFKVSIDILLRVSSFFGISLDRIVNYHTVSEDVFSEDIKEFVKCLDNDTTIGQLYWQKTKTNIITQELSKRLGFSDVKTLKQSGYCSTFQRTRTAYFYKVKYVRKKGQNFSATSDGYELYIADELGMYPMIAAMEDDNNATYCLLENFERHIIQNTQSKVINDHVKDIIFDYKLHSSMNENMRTIKEKTKEIENLEKKLKEVNSNV